MVVPTELTSNCHRLQERKESLTSSACDARFIQWVMELVTVGVWQWGYGQKGYGSGGMAEGVWAEGKIRRQANFLPCKNFTWTLDSRQACPAWQELCAFTVKPGRTCFTVVPTRQRPSVRENFDFSTIPEKTPILAQFPRKRASGLSP